MAKTGKSSLIAVFLFALLVAFGGEQLAAPAQTIPDGYVEVVRVVDGDTIVIKENGEEKTIRLIGVDTPETKHPRKPVECFGQEATQYTKDFLQEPFALIETDDSQGEQDRYGRMLAYVYAPNGEMLNYRLIADGYAQEYTYQSAYEYQPEFQEAQNWAQQNSYGLWNPEKCPQ